eukprot:3353281-Pyramimonas_sp.AAC.1
MPLFRHTFHPLRGLRGSSTEGPSSCVRKAPPHPFRYTHHITRFVAPQTASPNAPMVAFAWHHRAPPKAGVAAFEWHRANLGTPLTCFVVP